MWRVHFAMQISTMVVLAATFTVMSVSFLIHQNLNQLLTHWGDSISMTLYLKEEPINMEHIAKIIKEQRGVVNFEYVSKESAAKLFKAQVESYVPDMIFDSDFKNPLPASYEIKFDKNWSKEKYDEVVHFAKELMGIDGVEEVSYGQSWVESYASVVDKFNHSSWVLILVLLSGSLFVVGNSIRNSISQRRDEIEILELIGSTQWTIKKPFIFEGFILGFSASIISLFLSYFIYVWQLQIFDSGIGLIGGQYHLDYLNLTSQILTVLLGSLFGAVGAYFCVLKIGGDRSAIQAGT